MKRLAAILALALTVGCNQQEQPTNTEKQLTPLEKALDAEQQYGGLDDTIERRIEVRGKVAEYVKAKHPDEAVKGISLSVGQRANIYIVGVDLSSDKTLDLLARFYITDGGESYWKIEELTEKRAKLLSSQRVKPKSDDQ